MKNLFILVISLLLLSFEPKTSKNEKAKLSYDELKLYNLIMDYRVSKNLPLIPISNALTFVAQTHVHDLYDNGPSNKRCNMHSWSNKGNWTACCYTPDHAKAECMWNKPRELTSYTGDGFEIAFFDSRIAEATSALQGWKRSRGHNAVIINQGIWKDMHWNAIGIGIYKNYAVVWFGSIIDPEGEPDKPE